MKSPFRALLVLGAAVSIAIGVWAVVSGESVLIKHVGADMAAIARMYGAVMVAIGIGYAIAAAQPHSGRGLLVVLFASPAISAVVVVASVARSEIPAGRGLAFAIYQFAYCLLYFRTYPRVRTNPAS